MLDDARNVSDAQVAQRVSAMASIVENEAAFGKNGVKEVRAEADRQADNADSAAGRGIVGNIIGMEGKGLQETQVVRRRHEDKRVTVHPRPLHRRVRMVKGQASA